MMIEEKLSRQPSAPWRRDSLDQPSEAESSPAILEEQPKERSVFGLAAELKNLITGDRIHRSEQARRIKSRNKHAG